MEHNFRRSYGHLSIGIFLLIIGIALLLDKFDIFSVGSVWHYWPVLLIANGFGHLLNTQETWKYRKAIWWLFIGSWLFICELHLFGLSYHNSWPILLIGIGIGMLWKSAYHSHFECVKDHCHGN
jgi:hypothetical protein